MHILYRIMDHGLIDCLGQFFLHRRHAAIRDDKPVMIQRFFICNPCKVLLIIFFPLLGYIPHLQKHDRKTSGSIAGNLYGHIFPMPEKHLFIDIFVRQIDPSGKRHLPINHHNFPVVPVILAGRDKRNDGGKHLRLDTKFL